MSRTTAVMMSRKMQSPPRHELLLFISCFTCRHRSGGQSQHMAFAAGGAVAALRRVHDEGTMGLSRKRNTAEILGSAHT
jgi:hypothetical protein